MRSSYSKRKTSVSKAWLTLPGMAVVIAGLSGYTSNRNIENTKENIINKNEYFGTLLTAQAAKSVRKLPICDVKIPNSETVVLSSERISELTAFLTPDLNHSTNFQSKLNQDSEISAILAAQESGDVYYAVDQLCTDMAASCSSHATFVRQPTSTEYLRGKGADGLSGEQRTNILVSLLGHRAIRNGLTMEIYLFLCAFNNAIPELKINGVLKKPSRSREFLQGYALRNVMSYAKSRLPYANNGTVALDENETTFETLSELLRYVIDDSRADPIMMEFERKVELGLDDLFGYLVSGALRLNDGFYESAPIVWISRQLLGNMARYRDISPERHIPPGVTARKSPTMYLSKIPPSKRVKELIRGSTQDLMSGEPAIEGLMNRGEFGGWHPNRLVLNRNNKDMINVALSQPMDVNYVKWIVNINRQFYPSGSDLSPDIKHHPNDGIRHRSDSQGQALGDSQGQALGDSQGQALGDSELPVSTKKLEPTEFSNRELGQNSTNDCDKRTLLMLLASRMIVRDKSWRYENAVRQLFNSTNDSQGYRLYNRYSRFLNAVMNSPTGECKFSYHLYRARDSLDECCKVLSMVKDCENSNNIYMLTMSMSDTLPEVEAFRTELFEVISRYSVTMEIRKRLIEIAQLEVIMEGSMTGEILKNALDTVGSEIDSLLDSFQKMPTDALETFRDEINPEPGLQIGGNLQSRYLMDDLNKQFPRPLTTLSLAYTTTVTTVVQFIGDSVLADMWLKNKKLEPTELEELITVYINPHGKKSGELMFDAKPDVPKLLAYQGSCSAVHTEELKVALRTMNFKDQTSTRRFHKDPDLVRLTIAASKVVPLYKEYFPHMDIFRFLVNTINEIPIYHSDLIQTRCQVATESVRNDLFGFEDRDEILFLVYLTQYFCLKFPKAAHLHMEFLQALIFSAIDTTRKFAYRVNGGKEVVAIDEAKFKGLLASVRSELLKFSEELLGDKTDSSKKRGSIMLNEHLDTLGLTKIALDLSSLSPKVLGRMNAIPALLVEKISKEGAKECARTVVRRRICRAMIDSMVTREGREALVSELTLAQNNPSKQCHSILSLHELVKLYQGNNLKPISLLTGPTIDITEGVARQWIEEFLTELPTRVLLHCFFSNISAEDKAIFKFFTPSEWNCLPLQHKEAGEDILMSKEFDLIEFVLMLREGEFSDSDVTTFEILKNMYAGVGGLGEYFNFHSYLCADRALKSLTSGKFSDDEDPNKRSQTEVCTREGQMVQSVFDSMQYQVKDETLQTSLRVISEYVMNLTANERSYFTEIVEPIGLNTSAAMQGLSLATFFEVVRTTRQYYTVSPWSCQGRRTSELIYHFGENHTAGVELIYQVTKDLQEKGIVVRPYQSYLARRTYEISEKVPLGLNFPRMMFNDILATVFSVFSNNPDILYIMLQWYYTCVEVCPITSCGPGDRNRLPLSLDVQPAADNRMRIAQIRLLENMLRYLSPALLKIWRWTAEEWLCLSRDDRETLRSMEGFATINSRGISPEATNNLRTYFGRAMTQNSAITDPFYPTRVGNVALTGPKVKDPYSSDVLYETEETIGVPCESASLFPVFVTLSVVQEVLFYDPDDLMVDEDSPKRVLRPARALHLRHC